MQTTSRAPRSGCRHCSSRRLPAPLGALRSRCRPAVAAARRDGSSLAAPAPAAAAAAAAAVVVRQQRRTSVVAAASQPRVPGDAGGAGNEEFEEFEEGEEYEEGEAEYLDTEATELTAEAAAEDEAYQDELAGAPLDAESVRIRQQMAGEAGPSPRAAAAAAAAADADDGEYDEDESGFPVPEERATLLSDLLGLAAEVSAAALVQEEHPDVFITGITDVAGDVLPGDLYCCTRRTSTWGFTDGHEPSSLAAAVQGGAAAILAEAGSEDLLEAGGVPPELPVIFCSDTDELSSRLAAVFFEMPSAGVCTIAITGTSGKTSVAWLVRGVLEQAGQLTGMVGSIEHALAEQLLTPEGHLWRPDEADPAEGRECASPFSLVPHRGRYLVEEGTPNPLQMQRLLAAMRDRGADVAVVECSARGIAGGSAEWLSPNIAIFTNFGDSPTDLELFDSREEYLEAQLQLFRGLTGDQVVIVNIDDEAARAVLEASSGTPSIMTYSLSNVNANVYCESISLELWQTEIIVNCKDIDGEKVGRLEIITNLVGRHNIYNVLAAVATGVVLKVPLADIGAGIESVQVVPGRCEVVNNLMELGDEAGEAGAALAQLPHDFPVVVDAADTPQRLATVLEGIREAGGQRIFTVFGCDGVLTSGEVRARMGEVAHQRSEFVILTNASPSLESPADIIKDIVSGWPNELFEPYAAYVYNVFQDQGRAPLWFEPFLHSAQRRWHRHIMEDRFQAIRAAIGTAGPGDVVLLAGRGHKDWVDHADGEGGIVRGWFDDRVEARSALGRLEYLYALTGLDRSALPWGPPPDEGKTVVVELD